VTRLHSIAPVTATLVLKALPTPRKRSRCKMWLFCQRSVSQNVLGRCPEKHLVVADVMTRCLHKRFVSAVVVVTSTTSRTVVKATRLAPPILSLSTARSKRGSTPATAKPENRVMLSEHVPSFFHNRNFLTSSLPHFLTSSLYFLTSNNNPAD
jgi:hypothetical protein